ncbi:MAG: ferredoxin--NADP reductase [Halobacteriota archaeon]
MKPIRFETEVTQLAWRTNEAKSIRFKKPEGFDHLPGQWIFLTLGQGDKQKTKPLSLSSSPTENFLEVTKQLTGHEFSNALAALNVGDRVGAFGPHGDFTFRGEYDKVCMLSGGIGVTPQRSMIRYATDKALKTNIILLYSTRHEDNIAFSDDFSEMQKRNHNLSVVITITHPSSNWKGLTGRVDKGFIEKMVPDHQERIFYISGPTPMVDAMSALLRELKLPETRIKQENFLGYDQTPRS